MRDYGVPARREKSKAANALARSVQDRMSQWTDDNFQNFDETMKLIREGAPVQWVKLYLKAVELGVAKESNINININRQQDRENLQALARTRISLPDSVQYTPYEEIKPKEIAMKEEGET